MGANSIKEKYNQEYEVSLNISLNKSCYSPGENISGFLDIQPKYNINQTIFSNTQAIFKITQFNNIIIQQMTKQFMSTKIQMFLL